MQAELVGQPVNAHDLAGLKFVTQQVQTPILADESVFSVKDALHIIQTQSADLINIKLMKTGGIHEGTQNLCCCGNLWSRLHDRLHVWKTRFRSAQLPIWQPPKISSRWSTLMGPRSAEWMSMKAVRFSAGAQSRWVMRTALGIKHLSRAPLETRSREISDISNEKKGRQR